MLAITNISSNLTSDGDLNITSGNDIILQAVKINSGSDINIDSGNDLLLLTAVDSSFKQVSTMKSGTFTFKNNVQESIDTAVINNEITSDNGNINIAISNQTLARH